MNKFHELYKKILDSAENIRKIVVEDNIALLSYGEKMNKEDVDRIKNVVEIEEHVLRYLNDSGIPYEIMETKPNLAKLTFEGNTYVCRKDVFALAPVQSIETPNTIEQQEPIKEEPEQQDIPEITTEPDETEDTNPVISEPDVTPSENEEVSASIEEDEFEEESEEEIDETITHSIIEDPNCIAKENLIYERIFITLNHQEVEKKDNYEIMIAPLKVCRFETPSVPIIVSITNNKDRITKSSFDAFDTGRNLITIAIDDYELLCRGSFNARGQFTPIIQTTNTSVANGDVLTVENELTYGEDHNPKITKCYPSVPYVSNEGDSIINAFPLGEIGDNNFMIMTKTEEFVNYSQSASNDYGFYQASVIDDNKRKVIIPKWENECLTIKLYEE